MTQAVSLISSCVLVSWVFWLIGAAKLSLKWFAVAIISFVADCGPRLLANVYACIAGLRALAWLSPRSGKYVEIGIFIESPCSMFTIVVVFAFFKGHNGHSSACILLRTFAKSLSLFRSN
jgi:hypothetical protein